MRWIFLLSFLLFLAQPANSQSRYPGIVTGLCPMGNVYGDVELNHWSFTLFNMGGYVALQLNRRFWLQPEVRMVRRGPRYYDPVRERRYRQNLGYLQFPLLLRTYFSYNCFIEAGPYAGYLAYATRRDRFEEELANIITVGLLPIGTDNSEAYNEFDTGFIVGLGYGTGDTSVGIRYQRGFTGIRADPGQRVYNHAFEIILCLSIRTIFTNSVTR